MKARQWKRVTHAEQQTETELSMYSMSGGGAEGEALIGKFAMPGHILPVQVVNFTCRTSN